MNVENFENFKLFLSTAPVNWNTSDALKRFQLPNGETVSCILWNELFHITGTDIVKSILYRFECLGRKIVNQKKFEEGIFSDLRNLKPVQDATLEESRSEFLKFLYENQCIRTQKKQKVFYWFSVKHDKLFLDALERDLKRESSGQTGCTIQVQQMSHSQIMELAKQHCMTAISPSINQGLITPPQHQYSPPTKPSDLTSFESLIMAQQYESTIKNNSGSAYSSPQMAHASFSPQLNQQNPSPQMTLSDNQQFNAYGAMPNANYGMDEIVMESKFYQNFEQHNSKPYDTDLRKLSKMERKPLVHTCPYTQCQKQFKRQEHLRRHIRSHTGEKPYNCHVPNCRRSFARSDHLTQHIRTHELSPNRQQPAPLQHQNSDLSQLMSNSFMQQYDHTLTDDDGSLNHTSPMAQNVHQVEGEVSGAILNQQMDNLMSDLLSLEPDLFPGNSQYEVSV